MGTRGEDINFRTTKDYMVKFDGTIFGIRGNKKIFLFIFIIVLGRGGCRGKLICLRE